MQGLTKIKVPYTMMLSFSHAKKAMHKLLRLLLEYNRRESRRGSIAENEKGRPYVLSKTFALFTAYSYSAVKP